MTCLGLIIISHFIFTKIFALPNVCLNIMPHIILMNLILKVAPLIFIENHQSLYLQLKKAIKEKHDARLSLNHPTQCPNRVNVL